MYEYDHLACNAFYCLIFLEYHLVKPHSVPGSEFVAHSRSGRTVQAFDDHEMIFGDLVIPDGLSISVIDPALVRVLVLVISLIPGQAMTPTLFLVLVTTSHGMAYLVLIALALRGWICSMEEALCAIIVSDSVEQEKALTMTGSVARSS